MLLLLLLLAWQQSCGAMLLWHYPAVCRMAAVFHQPCTRTARWQLQVWAALLMHGHGPVPCLLYFPC